ncbi:DNA gyrase inhibitor YacG [Allosphingosinicella humi]
MSTSATTDARRHKCPGCGKPASATHAPFCSQGCRDRDLLKWLGEGYRLPGPPADGAFGERDRDD